jgi:hypothetical protein
VDTVSESFTFALEQALDLDEASPEEDREWMVNLRKTGDDTYLLELYHDQVVVDHWPIEPGDEVGNSHYTFRYTA